MILQTNLLSRFIDPFAQLANDIVSLNPVLLQLAVFGLLIGGVYALTALGLTMIFGVMDIINFAHGAFLVLGMYTTYYLTSEFGMNPFLTLPVALFVLFALGAIIEVLTIDPILEAPAANQLILTVGIWYILSSLVQIQFSPDTRQIDLSLGSVSLGSISIPLGQLYALIISGVIVAFVWYFLNSTDLGRAIRGTSGNRVAARYVGININRVNYITFGIGAALAGIAGSSITLFRQFDPFTGTAFLVNAFIVVVLGGLGSFPGAFFAGILIGFAEVFGIYYLPGTTYQVFIFAIFILVLLFKPTGLMGGEDT